MAKEKKFFQNPYEKESEDNKTARDFKKQVERTAALQAYNEYYDTNRSEERKSVKEWKAEHPDFVQAWTAKAEQYIALIESRRIGNILDNIESSFILSSKEAIKGGANVDRNKDPRYSKENSALGELYDKLSQSGFFQDATDDNIRSNLVTNNVETDLQYENIAGYKIHQTSFDLASAIRQIIARNKVIGWDLETTAGKLAGAEYTSPHITEFSFVTYDTAKEEFGKTFRSIIGATPEEVKEYQDILKRYTQGANNILDSEMITLKRLALMGNRHTTIDYDRLNEGVANFKTFAGPEDIRTMNVRDIQTGIRRLESLWSKQQGLVDYTYKGETYRIRGFERELLEGLRYIFDEKYVAIGHNSETFDIARLNRFISSNKISEEARKVIRRFMGQNSSGELVFPYHLDTLMTARRFFDPNNYLDEEHENLRKQMDEKGWSSFSLEALVRYFHPKYYENAGNAHAATTDVRANLKLLKSLGLTSNKKGFFHEEGAEYAQLRGFNKILEKISAANSTRKDIEKPVLTSDMVLFAKQHLSPMDAFSNYNLLMAVEDQFTGQIRTFDKFAFTEDGDVQRQLFGQSGLQRGVSYRATSIRELTTSNEFKETIRKAYPQLSLDSLISVTLTPLVKDSNTSLRAFNPITYIGARSDIQHALMDNTLHYASWNEETQQLSPLESNDVSKKDLSTVEVKRDSDGTIKAERAEMDINQIFDFGDTKAREDSATRVNRQYDLRKDLSALRYIQQREDTIKNIPEVMRESFAQRHGIDTTKIPLFSIGFDQYLRKSYDESTLIRSRDLARKVARKEEISADDIKGTFQEFWGFGPGLPKNIYPETLSNQLNRLEYIQLNSQIIEAAATQAQIRGGGDNQRAQFYYRMYMEGLEEAAKSGQSQSGKIGYQQQKRFSYEMEGFDISLKHFRRNLTSLEDSVVRVNLEAQGSTLASQIIRKIQGIRPINFTTKERAQLLREVQFHLIKTGQVDKDVTPISGDASEMEAARTIIQNLRDIREKDTEAGYLTLTRKHTIHTKPNFGLTPRLSPNEAESKIRDIIYNIDQHTGELIAVAGTNREKNETATRNFVDRLVDEVLVNNDTSITDEALKEAGYTPHQISVLREQQRVKRSDLQMYLTDVIGEAINQGVSFRADAQQKAVFAIKNNEQIQLSLPIEKFKDGMFYTELGASKVVAPTGLFSQGYGDNAHLTYSSVIGKAYSENRGYIKYRLGLSRKDGTILDSLQRITSHINEELRRMPAILELDPTDRDTQFIFQYEDLGKHIKDMNIADEDLFSKRWDGQKFVLDKEGDQYALVIQKLMDGTYEWDEENPKPPHIAAMHAKRHEITNYLVNTGVLPRPVADTINWVTRTTKHFRANLDYSGSMEDQYTTQKRKAVESIARAERLNIDQIRQYGKEEGSVLGDLKFGRAFETWDERIAQTRDQGLGFNADTIIRAKRVGIHTRNLQEVVASQIQSVDSAAVRDALLSMYTWEGAGVMHAEVFDRVFSHRDSTQKIDLDKIIEADKSEVLDLLNMTEAAPQITIEDNGKISIRYSNGLYVQEGDDLVHIKGLGEDVAVKQAKRDGMFRFGYFTTQGDLIDEQYLNEILERNKNEILGYTDDTQRKAAALNVLNRELGTGSAKVYVEDVAANPLRKVAEFSEKGMTRALMVNTGAINKNIAQVMENLFLRGRNSIDILDISYLDLFKSDNIRDTKLGALIEGRRQKRLRYELGLEERIKASGGTFSHDTRLDIPVTDEFIKDVIHQAGFSDTEDFYKQAIEERYSASRYLKKIFESTGILNQGEEWHFLTDHQKNREKHGDPVLYRNLIDEALERGYKDNLGYSLEKGRIEELSELVQRYLFASGAKVSVQAYTAEGKDRYGLRLEASDYGEVPFRADEESIQAFKRATNLTDENGRDITRRTASVSINAHLDSPQGALSYEVETPEVRNFEFSYGTVEASLSPNFDAGKITIAGEKGSAQDAWRTGVRAITSNEDIVASNSVLGMVRKNLIASMGEEEGVKIYEKYLGQYQQGMTISSGITRQIEKNTLYRPSGDLLINYTRDEESRNAFIPEEAKKDIGVGFTRDRTPVQAGESKYEFKYQRFAAEKGIDPKLVKNMLIELYRNENVGAISADAIHDNFIGLSYVAANAFNAGKISLEALTDTEGAAKSLGFKVVSIDDLAASTRGGLQDFEDSIYGKNLIVDLQSSESGVSNKLYRGRADQRYLALPYNPTRDIDPFSEQAQKAPQKSIAALQSIMNRYHEGLNAVGGESLTQDEKDRLIEQMRGYVRQSKEEVYAGFQSKLGTIASSAKAYMHDAGRFAAYGHEFTGLEEFARESIAQGDKSAVSLLNLEIDGHNLVKEAAKGEKALQFNYSILSLHMMDKIYRSSNMDSLLYEQLGLSKEQGEEIRGKILEHVQTKGTLGISAREPLQYRGSISARQIFFSGVVSGNEAIGGLTGAALRKEDYDADLVYNALYKTQVEVELNGRRAIQNLDQATINVLEESGAKITFLEDNGYRNLNSLMSSQYYMAAGEAQYYRDFSRIAYEPKDQYKDTSLSPQYLSKKDHTLRSYHLDGTEAVADTGRPEYLVSDWSNLSGTEKEALRNDYSLLMQRYTESTKDNRMMDALGYSGEARRGLLLRFLEGQYMENGRINEEAMIQGLGSFDQQGGTHFFKALQYSLVDERASKDLEAFQGQNQAGIVNHYTQIFRNIVQDSLKSVTQGGTAPFEGDLRSLLDVQQVNISVQESFLTAKNSAIKMTEEELWKTTRLAKAYQGIFSAAQSGDENKIRIAKSDMTKVLKDALLGTDPGLRFEQEGNTTMAEQVRTVYDPKYDTDTGNRDREFRKSEYAYGERPISKAAHGSTLSYREGEALIDNYVQFIADVDWTNGNYKSYQFATGNARLGKNQDIPDPMYRPESDNILHKRMRTHEALLSAMGLNDVFLHSGTPRQKLEHPEEIEEQPKTPSVSEDAFRDVETSRSTLDDKLSHLKASVKLPKGALVNMAIGVAGALMVSGYISNPSAPIPPQPVYGNTPIPNSSQPMPSTDQAAGGAQYLNQAYPGYFATLSDSNINMSRGVSKNSYIININGDSPQGQNQAYNAMNLAIGGSLPQTSSINIAMQANYSDLMSQAQVSRMIQTAMGF